MLRYIMSIIQNSDGTFTHPGYGFISPGQYTHTFTEQTLPEKILEEAQAGFKWIGDTIGLTFGSATGEFSKQLQQATGVPAWLIPVGGSVLVVSGVVVLIWLLIKK